MAATALAGGPMKTAPAASTASTNRAFSARKAEAGVNRLGTRLHEGIDDPVDGKVALARWRRSDGKGLVGHPDVERILIGLGMNRDRGDAQRPARGDDPAGDFPPVGNENSVEHVPGTALITGECYRASSTGCATPCRAACEARCTVAAAYCAA